MVRSFLAVADELAAAAPPRPWTPVVKTAEIKVGPRTFFVHVRVPEHVAERLREVQKEVVPDASRHQDIDHVTLVYTKKPDGGGEHEPEKVETALEKLRDVGAQHEPIRARIQGWGYFDGAEKDGKTTTALVALLDAPGLDHLHVDMARALKDHGIEPSTSHVFTPHITLGYLERHGRVDKPLPPLSGSFTIDKAHVAARDRHEVPLTGSSALAKAAASMVKELAKGMAEETKEHLLPPDLTGKLVRDHLAKEPEYYSEHAKTEELGKKAAEFAMGKLSPATNFTMSTSALRQDHRQEPGKGETSPVGDNPATQQGAMSSGGGFK